jgi:hypothetical protein
MAGFTRTNGDLLPVAVYDAATGNAYTNSGNVNAVSSANTVQPQGPQLQFFTIECNGATAGTYSSTIMNAVEQLATVMIYEYTDTTDDTIAIATYPAAAWTTATLDTAITAALTQAGAGNNATSVTATATFTN